MATRISTKGSKGQLSIEASIIILFTLLVLMAFWIGGPMQKSAEKSTDTNGAILAAQAIDDISSTVEIVALGGLGQKREFVIHEPFNSVDVEYENGEYTDNNGDAKSGPHMRFTIIAYDNLDGRYSPYYVGPTGRAWWEDPANVSRDTEWPYLTAFYYKNITGPVRFPIVKQPLCDWDAMKQSKEIRGETTRFLFIKNDTKQIEQIRFCCEAGFNLNMFAERAYNKSNEVDLETRYYFNMPPKWELG